MAKDVASKGRWWWLEGKEDRWISARLPLSVMHMGIVHSCDSSLPRPRIPVSFFSTAREPVIVPWCWNIARGYVANDDKQRSYDMSHSELPEAMKGTDSFLAL